MASDPISVRSLNRALLARQGLLARRPPGIVEAVEAIGALQAQHWPALPVALWSRVEDATPDALYAALERRELVLGTSLRGTLHLVSAREWPAYAALVHEASGGVGWRHTKGDAALPGALRAAVVEAATGVPRRQEELAQVAEAWVAERPDALDPDELAEQRRHGWKRLVRWCGLTRAPADGRWGAKTPSAYLAAPVAEAPGGADAVDEVVRRHLRAFGPAAADDVATWTGLRAPAAREAIGRLGSELAEVRDEAGRALLDLRDAPRPGDDGTAAPVRFLPAFDSTLLAYAPAHRARILPEAHRTAVYEAKNLRILATYLVDGFVAGTWTVEVKRREATLTLQPLERLAKPVQRALEREGEALLRATQPAAKAHRVVLGRGP